MRRASPNPWVFGYGSLMWRPGFDFIAARQARLFGFHRRLCVYSHHYRGTPDRPGLVFGLDRGGSCRGVAFEVAAARWPETLAYLRQREQLSEVYREILKPVMTEGHKGPVLALTYVVNRSHAQYAGDLPQHRLLQLIKQGKGTTGTCEDYVKNTLQHLRGLDVRDGPLERLGQVLDLG